MVGSVMGLFRCSMSMTQKSLDHQRDDRKRPTLQFPESSNPQANKVSLHILIVLYAKITPKNTGYIEF